MIKSILDLSEEVNLLDHPFIDQLTEFVFLILWHTVLKRFRIEGFTSLFLKVVKNLQG